MRSWTVHLERGGAGTLHARGVPAAPTRTVSVLSVDRAALVLGSTQPQTDADAAACEAAGIEIVRRRSGGGAVLLEPGRVLWIDVVVPDGDPLWQADVGRAFLWLGQAWVDALGSAGATGGPWQVHDGKLELGRFGAKVCFAGRGPGEVLDADGRKVVGISQRRTREGALFQCAVPLRWDAQHLVGLLSWPSEAERAEASGELAATVGAVDVREAALFEALVSHLPGGR